MYSMFCLFYFALNVFTLLFLDQSFIALYVKNPKTYKNYKIQKVWSISLSFVLKHIFPCTFVKWPCAFTSVACSLYTPYLCGRNLDIYVTVVNRSSNLSWMISQWYCWSWDMNRFVPIYLPTHLFYCFCLKELTKCKSPNEKRFWAAEACHTY